MKFKVGDRVAYYSHVNGREIGEVIKVCSDHLIHINWEHSSAGTMSSAAHPKQLRKLKPKRVAREWWVNVYRDGSCGTLCDSKERADERVLPGRIDSIRVREIL